MHRLVLFDIDGTLIHTGGAGSRAMTRAFAEACSIENGFDGVPVPGRTDSVILADACAKWGLNASRDFIAAFQQIYFRCLTQELSCLAPSVRGVLPGVVPLLESLAADASLTVGLLTGNYVESARLKLERFDLWRYFAFGAFGGDAMERERLVQVAIDRGRSTGMREVEARDVALVGDTPLDIACAHANGARVLAVATGSYSAEALWIAGADVAMNDLSDTGSILAWLRAGR